MDWERVEYFINEGYISKKEHPHFPLWIFNYTPSAQFNQVWTAETLACRGLITDHTYNVMARPFSKFFNYGEDLPRQDAQLREVSEKMDGSLGILYWWDAKPYIATRGSFASEQAEWATQRFQHMLGEWTFSQQSTLNRLADYTLLFEIIYPDNRVVVDYGDLEALVLIGARHTKRYHEMYIGELEAIAHQLDLLTPKIYSFDRLDDILEAATRIDHNQEGWVLRYSDNTRYKVKGDAYKLAHKFMTGITYNRVLEAMENDTLAQMIDGVPDEFLDEVRRYEDDITIAAGGLKVAVEIAYSNAPVYKEGDRDSRKAYAQWVMREHKNLSSYLFAKLDGRDIMPMIYKSLHRKEIEVEL